MRFTCSGAILASLFNLENTMSDKVIVDEIKVVFSQRQDSCADVDCGTSQSITIERIDAGAGMYYVIKTDRWAFDSIEEFVKLLRKVNIK